MSSIFSDPFFRRGSTLLGGEAIELDAGGNPVAGREVVGQVKAFQDVSPTGAGERWSNRLNFCIAVRWTGGDVVDSTANRASGTYPAGRLYKFSDANPLTEVDVPAVGSMHDDGKLIGVIDEYLTGDLRDKDIVWLVVKGPVTVATDSANPLAAGDAVFVDGAPGQITDPASATVGKSAGTIGLAIKATDASNKTRINLSSDII